MVITSHSFQVKFQFQKESFVFPCQKESLHLHIDFPSNLVTLIRTLFQQRDGPRSSRCWLGFPPTMFSSPDRRAESPNPILGTLPNPSRRNKQTNKLTNHCSETELHHTFSLSLFSLPPLQFSFYMSPSLFISLSLLSFSLSLSLSFYISPSLSLSFK